jgi:hypothetical protein
MAVLQVYTVTKYVSSLGVVTIVNSKYLATDIVNAVKNLYNITGSNIT